MGELQGLCRPADRRLISTLCDDGAVRHDELLNDLRALAPSPLRDAYVRFVSERGEAALRRDGGPEHVTGSCFVFSPDLANVLLCFHRKGGFWVQFGGHVEESDASIAQTAQREAREESGIPGLVLLGTARDLTAPIADLDRHELHGGFACAAHWDVGYVAVVSPDVGIVVSEESEDVRWFPVDALPAQVPAGLADRVEAARGAVRALA
jgi:8-oxo-dGTP pyrophosphatase MutT (NUDIX family)